MAQPAKVRINAAVAEGVRRHGVATYPHECCGALLGRDDSCEPGGAALREILDLYPLLNRRDDSPRTRFSVAPRDVIEADKIAQACGLEVVGWYHSHPDHPARPSEYDREHAWPWYSYVILKVENGAPREMTSWRLRDARDTYDEEEIEIETT